MQAFAGIVHQHSSHGPLSLCHEVQYSTLFIALDFSKRKITRSDLSDFEAWIIESWIKENTVMYPEG